MYSQQPLYFVPKVLVHIRMHKKILSYDELYLQQILLMNVPACDKYCVQQKQKKHYV